MIKMNRLTKAFGIGALVLALAGCSTYNITGVITGKYYEPARNWVTSEANPRRMYDDEDFILEVAGRNSFPNNSFPNDTIEDIYVTKDVYDIANIGDIFDSKKNPVQIGDQKIDAAKIEYTDSFFYRYATERDTEMYGSETPEKTLPERM